MQWDRPCLDRLSRAEGLQALPQVTCNPGDRGQRGPKYVHSVPMINDVRQGNSPITRWHTMIITPDRHPRRERREQAK